jgi:hypothetical protein
MKRIGQIFEDCRRACHRTGVQLASTRSLRYPCNKERFHHVVYVGQSIAITKNLMIRYPVRETDPPVSYDLEEIQDKGENTAHAVEYFGIPANRVVIIGAFHERQADSGYPEIIIYSADLSSLMKILDAGKWDDLTQWL